MGQRRNVLDGLQVFRTLGHRALVGKQPAPLRSAIQVVAQPVHDVLDEALGILDILRVS
jgi:hypothetical protein